MVGSPNLPEVGRPGDKLRAESDAKFLARLKTLGNDWRFSDEFIGSIVRARFPRAYDDQEGQS